MGRLHLCAILHGLAPADPQIRTQFLIIAHNRACAESIKNRLPDAILEYPSWMLENGFSKRPKSEKAFLRMILKERNCNIFVASADCPDSCRGIDLSLIHCSEVAFWKSSATASPERVVKAAFSGVVDSTDSMIVLESTANGRNNYFYREFHDASRVFRGSLRCSYHGFGFRIMSATSMMSKHSHIGY